MRRKCSSFNLWFLKNLQIIYILLDNLLIKKSNCSAVWSYILSKSIFPSASNIRSIECLRNPKNQNFIPPSQNIEPPNEIAQSENSHILEYTLNTQNSSEIPVIISNCTSLPNTSQYLENRERIRSPMQIINNRNNIQKNYNNKRQLISEIEVKLKLIINHID